VTIGQQAATIRPLTATDDDHADRSGQCNVFVRNRELLARESFSIAADEPFVEELTELVTRLAMGGLLQANPRV
jgi:hypothetical protein